MLLNQILLIYLIIHLLISITCFIVFCDSFTSKRYNGFVNNNLATLALLSLFAPVILMFLGLMTLSQLLMNATAKCCAMCLDGFVVFTEKIKRKSVKKNS